MKTKMLFFVLAVFLSGCGTSVLLPPVDQQEFPPFVIQGGAVDQGASVEGSNVWIVVQTQTGSVSLPAGDAKILYDLEGDQTEYITRDYAPLGTKWSIHLLALKEPMDDGTWSIDHPVLLPPVGEEEFSFSIEGWKSQNLSNIWVRAKTQEGSITMMAQCIIIVYDREDGQTEYIEVNSAASLFGLNPDAATIHLLVSKEPSE